MLHGDGIKSCLQHRMLQFFLTLQQYTLKVVIRHRELLNRREPAQILGLSAEGFLTDQGLFHSGAGGDGPYRFLPHDISHAHFHSGLPQGTDQTDRLNGVSAQHKEIILGANLRLHSQNLLHPGGYGTFRRSLRFNVTGSCLHLRIGKGLAVHLSARRHGHGIQLDIDSRHHIFRQCLRKE